MRQFVNNWFFFRLRQEEVDKAFQENATTPHHHHVQENEEDGEEEGEDEGGHRDVTKELITDESIIDPVEERRTLEERNERLHHQLKVQLFLFIYFHILFLLSLRWKRSLRIIN